MNENDDTRRGSPVSDQTPTSGRRKAPQPHWADVGQVMTMQINAYGDDAHDRWTAHVFTGEESDGITYPDSYELPRNYATEGEALDAAKKWAKDRGLVTTWATVTLRQKHPLTPTEAPDV